MQMYEMFDLIDTNFAFLPGELKFNINRTYVSNTYKIK